MRGPVEEWLRIATSYRGVPGAARVRECTRGFGSFFRVQSEGLALVLGEPCARRLQWCYRQQGTFERDGDQSESPFRISLSPTVKLVARGRPFRQHTQHSLAKISGRRIFNPVLP